MHEDSCIGINYAHMFPKCFRSFHTLLGSALVLRVVNFNSCRCNHFTQSLTCTRIPCRDSHCENGSFEVLSSQKPRTGPASLSGCGTLACTADQDVLI